jgi:DNA mismatch endonuclease, patch repair protein
MPRVPRYSAFRPASTSASEVKRRNRARDTKAELLLRRALWSRGLRYRLHDTRLPGKPDIVFRQARLVVFVDGDFWHGRNWRRRRAKLARGSNAAYWIPKIEANIARDRDVTQALKEAGWSVLRFWETDVLKLAEEIADQVGSSLAE